MESNMTDFLMNASALDLGLGLNTLQTHQPCHPVDPILVGDQSSHLDSIIVPKSCNGNLMEEPYLRAIHLKSRKSSKSYPSTDDCGEDLEDVQSKQQCVYVKVNMDGVVVGRKISLVDHANYSTLALQLENMFGGFAADGLSLFQSGSQFILFYKDKEEKWRISGDVPWKEFVDCAKRLRIVPKNKVLLF